MWKDNLPFALNELITLNGGGRYAWFESGNAGDAGEKETGTKDDATDEEELVVPLDSATRGDEAPVDSLDPFSVELPSDLSTVELLNSACDTRGNDLLAGSKPRTDDASVAIGSHRVKQRRKHAIVDWTMTWKSIVCIDILWNSEGDTSEWIQSWEKFLPQMSVVNDERRGKKKMLETKASQRLCWVKSEGECWDRKYLLTQEELQLKWVWMCLRVRVKYL